MDKHDEIPPEHMVNRIHKVCPACFHNWLAPKDEPDQPCPICKHNRAGLSAFQTYAAADGLDPVLQPWVMKLPWKMQSILFSSLRGPDQEYLVNTKQVSKWMRSVTQNNADPSKPYMNDIKMPEVTALYKELEHCPCHFVHHFLDGLAIIAYHHPDFDTGYTAANIHYSCAEELFHFYPESPEWFEVRHRDKRNGVDLGKEDWETFEKRQKQLYIDTAMRRFLPRSTQV